jgi:Mrp family chromosome partitioning ATPase
VLLVIQAGKTPCQFVQRAIDAVGREKVLGVVLNKVQADFTFGGDYYYRYYASYSKKTG